MGRNGRQYNLDKTRRFNEANFRRSLAWTSSIFCGEQEEWIHTQSRHSHRRGEHAPYVGKVTEAVRNMIRLDSPDVFMYNARNNKISGPRIFCTKDILGIPRIEYTVPG